MVGYITFFSCTFSKQERSIFLTDFHPNNTSFRHFANPKSGKNPPGLFSSKQRPTAVKGLEKQLVHALNRHREKRGKKTWRERKHSRWCAYNRQQEAKTNQRNGFKLWCTLFMRAISCFLMLIAYHQNFIV